MENITIYTRENEPLKISLFRPEADFSSVIIIAPDVPRSGKFYYCFAEYLREQNFCVVIFNYTTFTSVHDLKNHQVSLHKWASQEADSVIRHVKQQFAGKEIIYLAHGISGEIIGMVPASQFISRMIFISTSLTCDRLLPFLIRIRLRIMKTFIRAFTLALGYFPKFLSGFDHDLPPGVVLQWTKWCDNKNGLFDNFPENKYRKLSVPLLVFTFSDDFRCSTASVRALLYYFAHSSAEWNHIEPVSLGMKRIGRSGFFSSSMKEKLWIEMIEWMSR